QIRGLVHCAESPRASDIAAPPVRPQACGWRPWYLGARAINRRTAEGVPHVREGTPQFLRYGVATPVKVRPCRPRSRVDRWRARVRGVRPLRTTIRRSDERGLWGPDPGPARPECL